MSRVAGWTVALAAGAAAQNWAGWWALALVGFACGMATRNQRWNALRFGAGIALVGAGRLAWLAWRGAPVGDLHRLTAEITSLPVLTLSLLVPALVGFLAAGLGTAVGRRVLFH